MRFAALALVLCAGVGAEPAHAVRLDVKVEEAPTDCGACYSSETLIVRADRGERNDLEVTPAELPNLDEFEGAVRVADRGATIVEPRRELNCQRQADRSVVCPVSSFDGARITTGDGDDRVSVSVYSATVDGGNGDDTITTGSGYDTVDGGQGTDRVHTGTGRDVIRDAGGSGDLLDAGTPARPKYLGDDADTLDLSSRRRAVRVDLRTQTLKSRGERDRLRSIENVVPGRGDDTVIGNSQRNVLEEELSVFDQGVVGEKLRESGDDVLIGGGNRDGIASLGGDDRLVGNGGNDRLECNNEHRQRCRMSGGAGNDLLNASAGPDRLNGGPGRDVLYSYAGNDLISAFDGTRDVVDADRGFDRARVDRGLDRVSGVETQLR